MSMTMMLIGRNSLTVLAFLGATLAFCAANEDDAATEPAPPQQSFVCPADGYLNCMPIVPPERQAMCTGEYRMWIVHNCPNVEIVY